MLAIDTNILIRYLVADDARQAAKARSLIDNNDIFVATTVLLESEWVLRGVYGFSSDQRAKALGDFAGLPRVTLENPKVAAKALSWIARGVDFADGLHLAAAEGCDAFVSFDREFAKLANSLGSIGVRAP